MTKKSLMQMIYLADEDLYPIVLIIIMVYINTCPLLHDN